MFSETSKKRRVKVQLWKILETAIAVLGQPCIGVKRYKSNGINKKMCEFQSKQFVLLWKMGLKLVLEANLHLKSSVNEVFTIGNYFTHWI